MTAAPDPWPPTPTDGVRLADVLGGFSLASDLAAGLHSEHGARSCYIGMRLADALQLSDEDRAALFYTELLKDVGCTAYTSQLATLWLVDELVARRDLLFFRDKTNPLDLFAWAREYMAADEAIGTRAGRILSFLKDGRAAMREGFQSTCEMASRIAERLGMPPVVQQALMHVFDQWDGAGMPSTATGDSIPLVSRIVLFTSFVDVFHRASGRDAAARLASEQRGRAFDPVVVDAFLALAHDDGFWAGLEHDRIWDEVLMLEPSGSPYRYLPVSKLDEVSFAFADFTDMKAPHLVGHSRRVAALAEHIGQRLSLPASRLVDLHRAGLVYDIGLVAVPSFVLAKPHARLTEAEREQYRLHPYHSQRIIARIRAFESLVPAVAGHHERLDGHGYPVGTGAAQISLEARILAVADRFDALTHDSPDAAAIPAERAAEALLAESGVALASDVVEALISSLDLATTVPRVRRTTPAGLTTREVEVLRLVALGGTRKQVAEALVVSEGTVRSHLEHIYSKIGVSNRAGATLFAMEHSLLD